MALVNFSWIGAIELRNNIDNYRQCYECKMTNYKGREKCWFCQTTDFRKFPESFGDSLNMVIDLFGDFNIPIGVDSLLE